MTGREIVVVGASAGGVPALQDLVRGLPPRLPATLFVVVHSSPDSPSMLPELLDRAGALPARHAVDNERYRRGHIYIAPPDRHLLLMNGTLRVTRGPRENGFRPAVDPLFRTAAEHHGARVIGIVLSGALDDGTRGLQLIKRQGGIAIAQHVDEAMITGMPSSAIRNVEVDYVLRAAEMPAVITRLATQPVAGGMKSTRRKKSAASDVAQHGTRGLEHGTPRGLPSPFTCPECGGTMWERQDGGVDEFTCHVGHRFGSESLGARLDDRLEYALWTAFRTLEESVALQRKLAARARAGGLGALARGHDVRAREAAERAAAIQRVLTDGNSPAVSAPPRRAAPSRRKK